MKAKTRQLLLPAMVLVALAVAPPAHASWQAVLQDCVLNDGLRGDYTKSQLQEAKRHVTGERLAYTECLAEISAAMNGAGKSAGRGGGDGPAGKRLDRNGDGVISPAEKRAAKRAKEREERKIEQINDSLTPDGGIGGAGDDDSGGTSGALMVALLLLILSAVAAGAWYAARRNPAIGNAFRRVPLPGRRG